jgi:dipeptidyl aminopeptidase/acylaminoacyl peptidase
MKKILSFFFCSFFAALAFGQNTTKKILNHAEFKTWKKIEKSQISNDGRWISYQMQPNEGDGVLHIYNTETNRTLDFQRGYDGLFSPDNQYFVFKIKPFLDTLKNQRRRKVKDDALPKDTLCIYTFSEKKILKIPNVKSFKMPEKWSGIVAFQREPEKEKKKEDKKDTSATKVIPRKKKEENRDNGFRLVVKDLKNGEEKLFEYVREYLFAEKGEKIIFNSTGLDTNFRVGVYTMSFPQKTLTTIIEAKKGNFKNLSISKSGNYVAFLADTDTSRARIRPFDVYFFDGNLKKIITNQHQVLPQNWIVSENATPTFSKDEKILFSGIAPPPILQDTLALTEEIVNVEVWHYQDARLHTQQNNQLEEDKKRHYPVAYQLETGSVSSIVTADKGQQIRYDEDKNGDYVLITDDLQYKKESSWQGFALKDILCKNIKTGEQKMIFEKASGSPIFSPTQKFIMWYQATDSVWLCYNMATSKTVNLSEKITSSLYDELNDVPGNPDPYGIVAWEKNEKFLYIYDRFDIWKIDPNGVITPQNMTKGREKQMTYRHINVDKDKKSIDDDEIILLKGTQDATKGEGYYTLDMKTQQLKMLIFEPSMSFSQRVLKAKDAENYVFTKENFTTFPDLQFCKSLNFKASQKISNANPQQKDYNWGAAELISWTALDGKKQTGMLFKPENFDPSKKYPMIVNYYERSSQDVLKHRAPEPHRSNINYTFYASRGYLVFNPDVTYREGYPGESAMNSVVSGVTALIEKGFVDAKRVGIQGHSWGGYQTAYIIGKTDMFRCAEAGAPVVNMTSAYGGIRWESGWVRQFQYEKAQSRIGGTLWEYPLRYLENSPLFNLDKVNTPVLILHNDKDGAVPWYQGIEYFTGLRRLNKPTWLLNYNDEPHWPVKWQNRLDFNIRMQQFFDHYLLDAPMPTWMQRGVPALEKGILQGY